MFTAEIPRVLKHYVLIFDRFVTHCAVGAEVTRSAHRRPRAIADDPTEREKKKGPILFDVLVI